MSFARDCPGVSKVSIRSLCSPARQLEPCRNFLPSIVATTNDVLRLLAGSEYDLGALVRWPRCTRALLQGQDKAQLLKRNRCR